MESADVSGNWETKTEERKERKIEVQHHSERELLDFSEEQKDEDVLATNQLDQETGKG